MLCSALLSWQHRCCFQKVIPDLLLVAEPGLAVTHVRQQPQLSMLAAMRLVCLGKNLLRWAC